jgi:hypothetical protein
MAETSYANAFTFGAKNKLVKRPYLKHLKSREDLRTTYEAIRAGFVQLALERNRRATPFIAEARALKSAASDAKTPIDLLKIKDIQRALLTASGISDKASNHLEEADKRDAIAGLIKNFLKPAGSNFVEELVFRFLLTRGDTLGGSMRNVGGFMAEKKLARSVIAHLRLVGLPCQWLHSETKTWAVLPNEDADIELHLRGLSWGEGESARTLVYNVTVPSVGNNIDLCLLKGSPQMLPKKPFSDPSLFIALGELKGGIDPAGADEHWKTAHSALNRISSRFAKLKLYPHIFFIGAAIEANMAEEIWDMLQSKVIENAANLTDENQIASITEWLCNL